MGIIKNTWRLACDGSPRFISENKLRNVHNEMKEWVKTRYRNPCSRKSRLQSGLAALQSKMENEEITLLLTSQEKDLNLKILNIARCEKEEWRMKSRKLWLKGGDSNTGYFHKQTKARLSFSMIKELKDKDNKRMVE